MGWGGIVLIFYRNMLCRDGFVLKFSFVPFLSVFACSCMILFVAVAEFYLK